MLTKNGFVDSKDLELETLAFHFPLLGDYLQNHCERNSADCVPCEDRLPSCINLPDNNNPYPGKLDSEYYIKCYRNRTVSVEACQVSKYNPATRECSQTVSPRKLAPHHSECSHVNNTPQVRSPVTKNYIPQT